ncbi:prion-like-(Q/N-rich) domain-bearing protein 25 [Phlebotomus argentipes]|uniref:prion-like-(Q/N-rich) domain-bearing protein 25 n=1 Tax=Phlebotomus argentipes TaxID=94469 RepID=UPI002893444C|nr:prion-like-(Q/N-rich) domain-bearing protein 25 [Phlebotomus argentipes]XP_059612415.1 prion-like-(Q/N-rich) domain-bearing protein 25 [Phlebotomus argentipes]
MLPKKRVQALTLGTILICSLLISGSAQDLVRRRTSNVCQSSSVCPPNAYCEYNADPLDTGQCVCNPGYIIVAENKKRECYPVAKNLGDSCTHDDQCQMAFSTESECFQGRCDCKLGTHFVRRENTCYKSVKINDWCRLTNNCLGEGTVCRSGVCLCPFNKHPNEDFTECEDDIALGESCFRDSQCVANNSRCHDICRCRVSHVLSHDRTKCLKIAEQLYDECEESIQCTYQLNYSSCDFDYDSETVGKCKCRHGYHESNGACFVSVEVGGICEMDENCSLDPFSMCQEGRCVCMEGLVNINGECSLSPTLSPSRILTFLTLSLALVLLN